MAIVVSDWKIEHVLTNGLTILLLDFGDDMADEVEMPVEQQSETTAALYARWGKNHPTGGAQRTLSWTRRVYHSSPAAARAYCIAHSGLMPYGRTGKIRQSIRDGAVFEHHDVSVISAATTAVRLIPHATLTAYTAKVGKTVPISGYEAPGLPFSWITTPFGEITEPFGSI